MNLKKFLCLIFVFMMVFTVTILGYSNDKYEIQIPERFIEEEVVEDGIKVFSNISENFNILVKENLDKVDITELTKEQVDKVADEIDKALDKANMPNEILTKKMIKINNYDFLLIKNQFKLNVDSEAYLYQYKYIMTSENYIYYITYTTLDKEMYEEFEKILETFKIKDKLIEKDESEQSSQQVSDTNTSQSNTSKATLLIMLILCLIIVVIIIIIVLFKIRNRNE